MSTFSDAQLDRINCSKVIDACHPMPVTLHRAFDHSTNWHDVIDTAIQLGFHYILTRYAPKRIVYCCFFFQTGHFSKILCVWSLIPVMQEVLPENSERFYCFSYNIKLIYSVIQLPLFSVLKQEIFLMVTIRRIFSPLFLEYMVPTLVVKSTLLSWIRISSQIKLAQIYRRIVLLMQRLFRLGSSNHRDLCKLWPQRMSSLHRNFAWSFSIALPLHPPPPTPSPFSKKRRVQLLLKAMEIVSSCKTYLS